jgi:hypothetical protein
MSTIVPAACFTSLVLGSPWLMQQHSRRLTDRLPSHVGGRASRTFRGADPSRFLQLFPTAHFERDERWATLDLLF